MMEKLSIDQVVAKLIQGIESKTLANAEGKLPSERELLALYPISRYTLRQALNQLSKMGWIYQMQGRGSYVRGQNNHSTLIDQGDLGSNEDLTRGEKNIQTVHYTKRIINYGETLFLPSQKKFGSEQTFIELKRYRTLDNKPYLIDHSYYIPEVVGDISDAMVRGSMFEALEKEKQLQVGFIDKFIQSDTLTATQAEFFRLEEGMPTLTVRDDSYLRNGELLAFSKIFYDYRLATLYMHKKLVK